MKIRIPFVLSVYVTSGVACIFSAIPEATPKPRLKADKREVNDCSLLTSKEIETIQGGSVVSSNPSRKLEKGLEISQCYFLLKPTDDSIILTVRRRENSRDGRNPGEVWRETFHREREREKGESRERESE